LRKKLAKGLVILPEKLNVGVLFGGRSGEHDVSLESAASVMAAMDREKYNVIPIGISREGHWLAGGDPLASLQNRDIPGDCSFATIVTDPSSPGFLLLDEGKAGRVVPAQGFHPLDVVFPVLHGPYGEDGTVQGLLELAGLPYVGAGVLASAVSMDKEIMKILFHHRGLKIGDYLVFNARQWEEKAEQIVLEIEERLGYPCFIKPANMGSSVGISKSFQRETLLEGIAEALRFDLKVIVEAYVPGREIECSVLGSEKPLASLPGEIIPSNDFYDYEAKYLDNRSRLLIPAPLDKEITEAFQAVAVEAFLAVGCRGLGRVDFFYQPKEEKIIVNEINTLPGFTNISMYPKLWEASGLPYSRLIDELIRIALEHSRRWKGLD
jgi:D-alanine-D-alanine ligase